MPIELKEYDPGPFFDEMMAGKNRARPLAKELIGLFRGMGDDELSKRQDAADLAIKEMGVTFTVYTEEEGTIDRTWPFDIIPRIVSAEDWQQIDILHRIPERRLYAFDLAMINTVETLADRIELMPGTAAEPDLRAVMSMVEAADRGFDERARIFEDVTEKGGG